MTTSHTNVTASASSKQQQVELLVCTTLLKCMTILSNNYIIFQEDILIGFWDVMNVIILYWSIAKFAVCPI